LPDYPVKPHANNKDRSLDKGQAEENTEKDVRKTEYPVIVKKETSNYGLNIDT
jgi:hypothetical protein